MRATIIGLGLCLVASAAMAQDVLHQGYVTRNGTYVAPHYQTRPDGNPFNNYSTQGNVNPYTGQAGTVNPYAITPAAPSYNFSPPTMPPVVRPVSPYGIR